MGHEELMEKPKGRYKRLVEAQGRDANSSSLQNSSTKKKTSPPERQYFIVDSFSFPTTTTAEASSSSSSSSSSTSSYGGNGNPAAVVLMHPTETLATINRQWCQHMAAEFNVSETAFVWQRRRKNKNEKTTTRKETASVVTAVTDMEDTDKYEYDIRYYTPAGTEIDLCGHATLAAGRVLLATAPGAAGTAAAAASPPTRVVVFRTKHGLRLPVSASVPSSASSSSSSSTSSSFAIHMQLPWKNTLPYPVTSEPYAEVVTMLQESFGGTGTGCMNKGGVQLAPDEILFVGAGEDQEDVFVELTPNAFAHLPATEHINYAPMVAYVGAPQRGLIVCCAGGGGTGAAAAADIDFQSRFFGPKVGIPEDPVTGSAHCLLGPYFGTKLHQVYVRGYQASARGGIVTCRLHPSSSLSSSSDRDPEQHGRVELVGQAVVVMQGTVKNEKDTDVEKEESTAFSLSRACKLATPDAFYLLVGALGGLLSGSIFPSWGLLFGETINLLYRPVFDCTSAFLIKLSLSPPSYSKYDTCEEYWQAESDLMRNESFKLALFWGILVVVCVVGGVLSFWGFGNASERLSRRIRDSAFHSLVRQEVAFFDKRSVGKITSELQEDAAMIQTFTGQPIRAFTTAIASVLTGLVISFTFMGFATSLDMKQFMGEDEKQESGDIDASSPSGIVVETLLTMGTVSALTMEETRFKNFKELLNKSDEHYVRDGFHQGGLAGLSQFIQQWITAALFYWGGWLLMQYPDRYDFKNFLIYNFAIIFSLFGLGAAFQDMSDRKQMEASASRIFYLLDRVSLIDPLSKEGEILNTSVDRPIRRKSSKKAKRKSTMLPIVEADPVGSSSRTATSRDDNSAKPKTKKSSSSKKMNEISAIQMTDIKDDTGKNEDLQNALPKKKKKKKKKDSTRNSGTKLLSTSAATTLNDSSTEMHDTTVVDAEQENCEGAVDEVIKSKKKKKKKKKKNPTAAMEEEDAKE